MSQSRSILSLKDHYRSGKDDLGRDFFQPCMMEAVRYRRAVGYFSTSALLSWTDSLPRMAMEGGLIVQLIASPELSKTDYETLRSLDSKEERRAYQHELVEHVLEKIAALLEAPSDLSLRADVFAWLIANKRMELRFAFAEHVDEAGIFHEKIGVFEFEEGRKVAFTGSANETISGHRRNYESIDVYRNWIEAEDERIATKIEQFEEAWNGLAEGLTVLKPSPAVIDRIRARAPRTFPSQQKADASSPEQVDEASKKWRHQEEAVNTFLDARHGILEMATGTGKTRTALKILDRLIDRGEVDGAIFAMDGTDLLDQWAKELDEWSLARSPAWLVHRHFERHHELGAFALDPQRSLMVISRGQLHRLLQRLSDDEKKRILIVHDEVHGLGTPSLVRELTDSHAAFQWRLGLSATPERAYDEKGNQFISREIGPTLYEFPLEAAIRRGVLTEFDYQPLEYELTSNDRDRLQSVYAKKAARARDGNPMSNEELWTEIAKVYKTAEMKPAVFAEHVQRNPEWLNRCILFVETREYGEQVLSIIDQHTHRYRTYYAEDDRSHLVAFARGEIDCLITCHRISQGIDIRSLSTVVLFASARSKLETIQRIGRCLRSDPTQPDKRALVIDFVRPSAESDALPNADQERCEWLSELSGVRREE